MGITGCTKDLLVGSIGNEELEANMQTVTILLGIWLRLLQGFIAPLPSKNQQQDFKSAFQLSYTLQIIGVVASVSHPS